MKKNHSSITKLFYLIIVIVLVTVVGFASFFVYQKYYKKTAIKISTPKAVLATKPISYNAVEAGLLPYTLNSPLSRMAVFATNQGQLLIAGGYTSSNTTSSNLIQLNPSNGNQTIVGNLSSPVHDSSYATVNNSPIIFGGGSASSSNVVQTITSNNNVTQIASLNQPRSDSSAITVNNTTYIIGGYNGNTADQTILSTTNGKNFTDFGNLKIAVRYTALASLNNIIYVFGGQAVNGPQAGNPLNIIQTINTVTHQISLLSATLPQPASGAIAVTINGEILLAGGQSNAVQNYHTGVGTTQAPGINLTNSDTIQQIYAFNPNNQTFLNAGLLQVPIANAGTAIIGNRAWIIGGESNNQVTNVVQMITPNSSFGIAGTVGAGSPYYGEKLLIADRGNNRILLLNPAMQIVWQYPSPTTPASPFKIYFPDDAFFANHGTAIISNQENNNTIVKIAYPSGKILWTYGHPMQAGSAPGYLRAPDDAYQLQNGQVVVADDQNCRILFINPNGTIAHQIGTPGICTHNPGVSIGSPNGDTPLYDGNILISEIIGSWVSEYTPQGKMVWAVHLPISYPSDPQQLGASPTNNNNLYLIADYSNPGAILTFNRQGQILSRYQPTSGPGELNKPSLVELLPSGVYMANDDHNDRMVAIDPTTQALVWQYGIIGNPGTGVGQLNKVDGFDILGPNGTTPTHGASN